MWGTTQIVYVIKEETYTPQNNFNNLIWESIIHLVYYSMLERETGCIYYFKVSHKLYLYAFYFTRRGCLKGHWFVSLEKNYTWVEGMITVGDTLVIGYK